MILIPPAALGVFFRSFLIKVTPDTLFKQGVSVFALAFSSVHIVKMIKSHYSSSQSQGKMMGEKLMGLRGLTGLYGFLGEVAGAVALREDC